MAKKILTIDEALEGIREFHAQSTEKPILAGVWGHVDAGKSYFCAKACRDLAEKGKRTGGVFYTMDYFFDSQMQELYPELQYLFYHTGINSENPLPRDIAHWNREIQPYTQRNLDLSVVLFNPLFSQPHVEGLLRNFDFVIANPASRKKGLYQPAKKDSD